MRAFFIFIASLCSMDPDFYQSVSKSTAHRPIRDYHASLVFENPQLLNDLIAISFNTKDDNHHKGCWILELVLEKNTSWLIPYLDRFCKTLPQFSHDGAVRSISKISWFTVTAHAKSGHFVSEMQLQKITESCFDWLIGETKVASKAYAMRALFEIGKSQQWVYPELKSVLELGYPEHSAAYQAAAKELLRKIK